MRRVALGSSVGVAVVLTAGALAAGSAGPPDDDAPQGSDGPSKKSKKLLREVLEELDSVPKTKFPPAQKRALNEADRKKGEFTGEAFTGGPAQQFFGCGPMASAALLIRLESADLGIEVAARTGGKEMKEWLDFGSRNAAAMAADVAGCAGVDEGQRAIARDIARRAASLAEGGKTPGPQQIQSAIKRLKDFKRALLAGQSVFDCDAFDVYTRVKSVNLWIYLALSAGERERREAFARNAAREGEKLLEFWRRAPCDTACSDEIDNDEDGSVDASDPGCITGPGGTYDRSDRSEQHGAPAAPPCPGPGTSSPVDVVFSYESAGSRIIRHNLRGGTGSSQVLIETDPSRGDFDGGGPVDLGTRVCGSGTTATAEWVRSGTGVSWHLRIANPSGVIPPANFTVHAGADTR